MQYSGVRSIDCTMFDTMVHSIIALRKGFGSWHRTLNNQNATHLHCLSISTLLATFQKGYTSNLGSKSHFELSAPIGVDTERSTYKSSLDPYKGGFAEIE